nr:hypothetical protein [uncultured Roseateles sp.]
MRHHTLKIPRWQKRWLYTSFTLLLLSGLPWLLLHYGRDADTLPPPAEAWLMRMHGLASMFCLLGLGMLSASHLLPGWRLSGRGGRAKQRGSGLWLSSALTLCTLLAYGLYYLIPEALHEAAGWLHACLGLLALGSWWWHRRNATRHHHQGASGGPGHAMAPATGRAKSRFAA